jgi:hypothetical protein
VLKAATGGYDGKGVWVVHDGAEAAELLASGVRMLAEQLVPLQRELAAVVARSPYGQGAAWPVVETVQADGICVEVVAPAPGCRRSGARGAGARAAARRTSWRSSACSPSSCSRRRRDHGQRAGHATAQQRPLDDRGLAHVAVRAAPAGGARLPARRDLATARWTVMANLLGGDEPDPDMDRRLHLLWGATRAEGPPLRQAEQARPQDRPRHVLATTSTTSGGGAQVGAAYLRDGTWPDDWPTCDAAASAWSMGSDSDWPVMSAAAEAAGGVRRAHEVRVLSPTAPARDARVGRRRRRAGAARRRRRRRGSGAPAGHDRLDDAAAGGRRAVPLSTSTAWTRCCRSWQCRPACRSRTVSWAARATPGLLAVRILAAGDPALRERMRAFQEALAQSARDKDAALQERVRATVVS